LAHCDKYLGENEERLQCLMELENRNPEDMELVKETGLCLIAMKRYEEAQKRFFQLEVTEHYLRGSARAIAWCSFMVDNHDRARTYYEKLLATPERTMQDWLNAAHVELVTRNNGKAIEYYRKAAALCKDDEEFSSNLMADSKILVAKGISTNDLILVRDIVS
jgi:tetratricopeptide (TPR) repeat protein